MILPAVVPSRSPDKAKCIRRDLALAGCTHLILVCDGIGPQAGWDSIAGIEPFIFARNVNLGISRALASDRSADGVLLCNDDVTGLFCGAAVVLRATAINERCGIAAACTLPHCAASGPVKTNKPVPFACVWITRQTIEAVGLLDERFDAYGWEDNDYLWRCRAAGIEWVVQHNVKLSHGAKQSEFRCRRDFGLLFQRGREQFRAKWGMVW